MALDDAHIQLKLMEREPKTVEDALNMATKLEVYETSLSLPRKPDGVDDGRGRRKPKKLYSIEGEEAEENSLLHRQVADLQKTLAQAMKCLEDLTHAKHSSAAAASKAAILYPAATRILRVSQQLPLE